MRDWEQYVRKHLSLPSLARERESRIVRELASQLEDFYREAVARGMREPDADAHARAQVTDWTRLAESLRAIDRPHAQSHIARWSNRIDERAREKKGWTMAADLWQDIRYASRRLFAQPGFGVTAVLTLALGIAATTAIFSVVYGVLLKPLPFPEPEQLVGLYHLGPGVNLPVVDQGPATYFTYRESNRVFEDIGAWDSTQVTVTPRSEPERVEALSVTDGMLPLLRVQPLLGRLFSKEDDLPGSPPRVVLTYGYWQRRFGGAEDIIGELLQVDDSPHEVIGVLPSSFKFLRTDPAVLLPMRLDRANVWVVFYFRAVARLKPGVTLSEANADVARMIPLLVQWVPEFKEWQLQPKVRPLAEDLIGELGRILWILFAIVTIVLLIACANVANLFLVRAEGRQQELAVRAALGASRGRLARELVSESVVLGLAGGLVGLLFARGGIELLRALAPAILPRVDEIGIDPVVLLFTLGVSVLTGLLFGLAPVLRFGTPSATALKEGGRSASDAAGRHRTRHTLVVAEIALALVLLIVSGLMIRTFVALRQVDPGFVRPEEVQTFRIAVPGGLVRDPRRVATLHAQIAGRLRHVPGVVAVGLSSSITMDGDTNANPTIVEHVPVPGGKLPPHRRFKYVGPGYFETMGNRLVAGRPITWADVHQARPVVVVSENLAREHWRDPSEALGKRITNSPELPWREIVGVVGNERDDGLNQPPTAIVYWPMLIEQFGDGPLSVRRTMAYAVRSTRVGAPGFLHELQQAIWAVNPNLPLADVRTLDEIQADSMAQTSFTMVMLAIAASVALLLGVVGIYGVIAYSAAQRTREIGIRVALGAQAADVRRMILVQGMMLTGVGIGIGFIGALGVTRVLRSLLYETSPTDPLTFAGVILLLAASALLACWVPARRAMRTDPIVALRCE